MAIYANSSDETHAPGSKHEIREGLEVLADAKDPNSGIASNSSTGWVDISGHSHDSYVNLATYNPKGPWFDFDGSNDYVFFSGGFGITENVSFSMELMVKFDAFANPRGGLMSVGAFGDSYGFHNEGSGVRFGMRPGGTLHNITTGTLLTGTWYYFTGTYNEATNKLKLYMNGSQIGSSVTVTTTGLSTGEQLQLGRNTFILGGSSTGADYFNGQISVVRMYKHKVLSQDEHIYNWYHSRQALGV